MTPPVEVCDRPADNPNAEVRVDSPEGAPSSAGIVGCTTDMGMRTLEVLACTAGKECDTTTITSGTFDAVGSSLQLAAEIEFLPPSDPAWH
jgi:hypothetical protein